MSGVLDNDDWAPLMASIRHRVDTMTPHVREGITRSEVATLALATGMAMVAEILRSTLSLPAEVRSDLATVFDDGFRRVSDGEAL